MKKFVLSLGLTLVLTSWGWQGYSGFGATPAHAQPPGYYDPYYCDPNYYYNCYSTPYVDPNSQYFLYYVLPREFEERRERRRHERHERREHREHEGREYYEHR